MNHPAMDMTGLYEPGDPPFTYCNWVKAQPFREWLEAKRIRHVDLSPAHRRRFSSAASNSSDKAAYVTYEVVEAICIQHGYHVSELPDELWAEKRTGLYQPYVSKHPQEFRDAAVKRVVVDGETRAAVSRSCHVSTRTLNRWINGHR